MHTVLFFTVYILWIASVVSLFIVMFYIIQSLFSLSQNSDLMLIYRQWFVNLSVTIHEVYRQTQEE
jgi:hypothetical protein